MTQLWPQANSVTAGSRRLSAGRGSFSGNSLGSMSSNPLLVKPCFRCFLKKMWGWVKPSSMLIHRLPLNSFWLMFLWDLLSYLFLDSHAIVKGQSSGHHLMVVLELWLLWIGMLHHMITSVRLADLLYSIQVDKKTLQAVRPPEDCNLWAAINIGLKEVKGKKVLEVFCSSGHEWSRTC